MFEHTHLYTALRFAFSVLWVRQRLFLAVRGPSFRTQRGARLVDSHRRDLLVSI